MSIVIIVLMLIVCGTSTAIVLTTAPRRQVLAMAVNGFALSALFMALQAPDVAFSEIVVGGAALPLFFFAALSALRADRKRRSGDAS
jgi:uncharacterized MnhB-related membrane protein